MRSINCGSLLCFNERRILELNAKAISSDYKCSLFSANCILEIVLLSQGDVGSDSDFYLPGGRFGGTLLNIFVI